MAQHVRQKDDISQTLMRIKTDALALVCAAIGGAGLFMMTIWLVIKDGPEVGPHLKLLSNYFVGYSVTWTGSFVGFFYGALTGGIAGWAVGRLYNKIVNMRLR